MAAIFPTLSTGAVAQYPATRTLIYSTELLQFIDGLEQRYRNHSGGAHNWTIQLHLLSDAELADLEAFFLANEGQLGAFAFTDPWSGVVYPNCCLVQDGFQSDWRAEAQAGTELVIRENRT